MVVWPRQVCAKSLKSRSMGTTRIVRTTRLKEWTQKLWSIINCHDKFFVVISAYYFQHKKTHHLIPFLRPGISKTDVHYELRTMAATASSQWNNDGQSTNPHRYFYTIMLHQPYRSCRKSLKIYTSAIEYRLIKTFFFSKFQFNTIKIIFGIKPII